MAWPVTTSGWIDLVRDWLDVDDTLAVPNAALATCLDMAVDNLNADVDSLYAEAPPVAYVCTGTETWPMDITALGIPDYNRMILVNAEGGPAMDTKAISEMINLIASNAPPTSKPVAYAVQASQMYVWPVPSTGTKLEIRYSKKMPYLSDTVDANVFTENHQSAFLYAALIAAEPYIAEDERLGTWKTLYDGQINTINLTAKQARMGSSPLVREFNVYGGPVRSNVTPSGILMGG